MLQNTTSTARQYDLVQRALDLGWPRERVFVIDQDQGQSGASAADRDGFRSLVSEAELHWLRNRLLGGKLEKAKKGQLRFRLPTGLIYDSTSQVILDPDEQVQAAVRLVFDLFDELGSARAVVKHFTDHQLLFPTRSWGGVRDGELVWKPLCQSRSRSGCLDGIRATSRGYWWIKLTPEIIAGLRKPVRQRRKNRSSK